MKKTLVTIVLVALLIMMCFFTTSVYAANESVLDEKTEGQIVKTVEKSKKDLEYYKNKYGSDAYGMTAYVLHLISIYSIPFCFLGIAISGIYQYIIGIRKLDIKEKGLTMMVTFVTTLVICQILPLAFAIVVKFGRG